MAVDTVFLEEALAGDGRESVASVVGLFVLLVRLFTLEGNEATSAHISRRREWVQMFPDTIVYDGSFE